MSIKLSKNRKIALAEFLEKALKSATVKNGNILDVFSVAVLMSHESVLEPKDRELIELSKYIGDTPIFEFTFDYLGREISQKFEYDRETSTTNLSNLKSFEDTRSIAERIIQELESLPWEYTLTLPLTNRDKVNFLDQANELKISEEIHIVKYDSRLREKYPNRSKGDANLGTLEALLIDTPDGIVDDGLYAIQVKFKGYSAPYTTTASTEDAIGILESFYGICLALNIFTIDKSYRRAFANAKARIHKADGDSWKHDESLELTDFQSKSFNSTTINDFNSLVGTQVPDEKMPEVFREWFKRVSTVFENQDESKKIMQAAKWFFESLCDTDKILSFVRATVAMEILLGDKKDADSIGVGTLLSNRCAYLICESQSDRLEIIRVFKQIYNVRSRIVHKGERRLTLEEKNLLHALHSMCKKVIIKEIELIGKKESK